MASTNIARLGVVLGLDTAEFTASIDKAISINRRLGMALKRDNEAAAGEIVRLKQATDDYGKTLTQVELTERAINSGRFQGVDKGLKDTLLNQAKAYDAVTKSTKAAAGGMNAFQKQSLMYQTTDFFTQVASGQSVMIAAIQQGGQLKDTMGGLGNMFKMLGSLITPFRVLVGGTAAVLGVLAYGAYQGKKEFDELNKSIALTGNYSGIAADSFDAMAKKLSGSSQATISQSKEIFGAMLSSGQFVASTFDSVSSAIQKYSELSGLSQKEAASKLIPSLDGSAASARKLNNEFNFLSIAEYKRIEILASQGQKNEAILLTSKLLTQSWKDQTKELGLLDRSLISAAKAYDDFWSSIKKIGKPKTDAEQIAEIRQQISLFEAKIVSRKSLGESKYVTAEVKAAQASINILEKNLAFFIAKQEAATKALDKKKDDKQGIDELGSAGGMEKSKALIREIEKTKADIKYEQALVSASDRQKIDLEAAKKTSDLISEFNAKSELEKRVFAGENDALIYQKHQQILAEQKRKQAQLTSDEFWKEMDQQNAITGAIEKENALKDEAQQKFLQGNYATFQLQSDSQKLAKEELLSKINMIGLTNNEIKIRTVMLDLESKIAALKKSKEQKPGDIEEGIRLAKITAEGEIGLIRLSDQFENMKFMSDSVFSNMNAALDNFVKTGKLNFKGFAQSVIQDMIAIQLKAQATSLLGMAFRAFGFGGGASSNTGVGGLARIAAGGTGGFANGGDPPLNVASMVGERGPELFVPKTAGTIIPNHQLNLGGGGTTNNITNYNIQAIDTKSFEERILGSSKAVWAANAYGNKNLAVNRGRT